VRRLAIGCLALALLAPSSVPDSHDAQALVERVEQVMRGDTVQYKAAMTITRPRWTRTVVMRSWDDRLSKRSLTRILSPAKDRGTGFLKIDQTLWTYLPRVERTTRMPPSMLLQPWMGSDMTNDDLVRESSIIDDYTARLLEEREIDGESALGVELIPKEEAPVVWSRIEIWVEKRRLAPILEIFYDEPEQGRFEEVRRMIFSDIREVQGRPVPHSWVIEITNEPEKQTRFEIEEIRYDEPIPDSLFTLTELKRAEAVR
jgi:outer membrane lipoprotein-sorting protein